MNNSWSERIRAVRDRHGLTQVEFAHRLRTHPRRVQAWEAGAAAPQSMAVVGMIEAMEREPAPTIPAEPWSGRVKALRGRVGMTQIEFAEALGMRNQATICRWEHGVALPSKRAQEEIARMESEHGA